MAEQSGYIVPVNFVAEGQAAVNAALTGTATKIRQISTEAKQAEKDATKALNAIATAAGKATGEIKKLDEKLTSVGKKSPAGTAAGVSASAPIAPGSGEAITKWIADFDKIKTQLIGIERLFRQVESVAQSLAAIQIAPEIASELATGKAYLAIATAAQKAAAELQAYDAVARKQIATDKELLSVKQRLNDLQGKQAARQDPGYQKVAEDLRKLEDAERRYQAEQARGRIGLTTELALLDRIAKARYLASAEGSSGMVAARAAERENIALKTQEDLLDRIAKARYLASAEGSSGMVAARAAERENIALKTQEDLLDRIAKARYLASAEGSSGMVAARAAERENIALKTQEDLLDRIAKARYLASAEGSSGMVAARAAERENIALKTQEDLLDRIAKARYLASAEGSSGMVAARAAERENIALKTQEDLLDKIAAAKARSTPEYQKEAADLARLTRAEMEKVAVDKLIDKLYQDRARIIAYSSDAYKQEAAGLAKLTMEERVAAETAKQLEIQQQRVAKAMALTDPAVRELIKDYNKLAAETREATASTERFNLHAAGLNNITAGLRAALAGVGMGFGIYTSATIVAASATFAFVSAVKSMVATTSEFTGEMARISAVMGTTEAQFEAVKQRSLELGASTRYSATEVASAFREMGMSGMSFQESMQGVTAVLSLASIGNMDFFQATDIATNILFGFGMAATDLTHVVDVMAKTVASSNQDITQLGNAMSYAAPIASSFGLSLEMAASMTEVLANAGIKASRAGTTLRRTLTALFSDSENVNKELGELGVTVNTLAQDADRELLRVLNELNKATNGATTGVGNLIKAVGLYAAPGFLKLVASANEATGSLQEVYKATQDVAGAAYEMQKRIEDFIGVDWETVKSAGESLSLAFGELYIKALREATQETAAWLQGLADSKKAVLQLAEAVEILGMAVGGAVVAFIGLGAVKYVIGALMGVRAAWAGVETATLAATAATKWYGKAALFAFRSLQMVAGFAILATAIWAVVEAYKAFTNVKKEALKGDLNLANANKVLAPAFDGDRQISKYSEAEAVRAADIRRGLEDLYKQRDTLEESVYVQQRLTEAGKETGAAIARLTLEQDKLNKAIAESEKAFRATMADLLKADEARLQGRKPVLEMEITIAQESLTKAEATVADIQERMRLRLKEVTRPLPGESRSNWAVYRRNTRADRFRNESGEWRSMTEELTTAEDALQLINDSLAKKRDELRDLLARLGQIAVEAFVLQVPISVEAIWQINQASVTQLNREIDELLATRGKAMKEAELQEAKKLPDRAKEPVNHKQIEAWDQEFAAIVGLGEAMAIMRTQRDLLKEQAKRGENATGLEELTAAIDLYEKRVGAFVAMGDSMGKVYKSQAEISQRAANDIDTLNAKIAEGIKANDEALRHAVENTKAPADQLDEVLKRMAEYQTKWHAMAQRQAALKDVLKEGGQENAEANLAEAAALELLSVAVTDHGKDIADYTRLRKELAKEYEKSLAGMDKLAEAEDDLAARIRNKGEALDKDRSQLVSTIVEYNALKDSVDAGRGAYAEAQTALAELTRQGTRSGAQWEAVNQVISEQERRMAAVRLLTDAYGDSIKELGDKLLEAARAQKKYQDEVVAGEADIQKMIDDRTRAKLPLGEQRAMLIAQSKELREQLDAVKADIAAMLAAYQELERLGQTPLINTGMANLQFALAAAGQDAAALVGRLKDSQTDINQVESDTESLANSNETLAKSYREAKQALDEFLNAPQEWNFPDTLKGQTDLLLAQAQAVLDELKGINREMDTLEVTGESHYNTKIGGYSRVSRHRGATDPGTAFGGYTSLSVSNAEYAAQAAKSLGLNSAQTSMLNQSIDLITERAKALNLNRDAVLALITAESSWNPGNVSPAGAVGLMQLMPGTAKGIGEAIGVDYKKAISGQKGWNENLIIGTEYLAKIIEQRPELNAVLAEYNGGDKGAKYYERTGKFFTETAAFVPTVRGLMEDIQKGSASWEEFGTAGAAAVAQVDVAAQAATSPAEAVSGAVAAVNNIDKAPLDNYNAALQATSMSTLALADGLVDIPPAVGEMASAIGHANDSTTVLGASAESMSLRSVGLADATSALSISYDQLAVTTGLSETAFDGLGVSFDGLVDRSNGLLGPVSTVSNTLDEVAANAATADEQLAKEGATAREAASYHEDLGKRLMADKEAYEALTVTGKDYRKLTDMQTKTLEQLFIETEKLKKIRDEMGSDGMDERELDMINRRKEAIEKLAAIYKAEQAQRAKVWEELVASGQTAGLVPFKYDKDQLQSLSDGYDSATTRTRAFRVEMERIRQLEDEGYLTKSEAALAKIDARFENLDPLTKDVATNIMNTLKNVATGASSGSEAMKDLRQSLVDIAMEKYVVKIGLDIVGSVMKPFLKTFEHIAFSMLSGLGSLLSSGLGAMTGGGGATGMTGGGGAVGGVTSGLSGLSTFSSIGSMFSTAFSLGGTFLNGVFAGFQGLLTTNAFATMGGAMGAIGSGSSVGMAAGAGVLAVYALPVIIAAVAVLSKYMSDQKPRTGAFAATTHGGVGQLEDNIGVKGGFGLTFGVNDKGSANIDAEEMREAFEGFAKVSLALEQFYGADIAAEVEATLKDISNQHYAKTGILNYAMDMNEAFDVAFTQIIDAAAATGDSVAVVMKAVVGDLTGTTENMAKQIESAMQTTSAVIQVAKAMEGTDAAKILELGDDLTANALRLVDYARSLQWTGEELSATLERMALYLTGLDAALELTGTQTEATGQDFIDLARNLAYAADEAKIGMAGLIQLQNNYYQHFFTEEERALKIKEDSLKAIADWNTAQGLKGIDTSAELRAYIETLDLETEAGRAAYVEAMKITLAFIALDEALDKLGDTVIDVTDKFAAQRKSLRDLADRLDPTDPLSQEQRDSATDALRKAGYQGDLYDAQGLADFLRTLADLEDAGGKAGKDLQEFIDTFTGVFDELARIAEERSGLEMRLLELTGTKTQILAEKRRLEIEATDESNRALLRYIHTLEDAAAAAAEMASLTERLYAAAGDDAMVTQLQRQAELAAALSDGARAMLLMLYAIEDSAAAADAANKQAEEAAQAANDAARAAFDANQEATRKQADAVQELVSTLQSLRDALKSAIEAIFIETPLTRVSTRDEAQEQITAALVAARGGVMPDLEKLSPYLDVVSQNAESQFRTLEEYQRDAYRTRAELVELEALLGDQQTIEEQTLEALNTIINESFPESDANADQNADKIVVDVQRLIAVANAINEGVLRMDTDMDGLITFAEMQTALAGLATDPELRALFDMLDVNGDGILSALEALPLKIAQNMTGLFDMLDTNLDGLLTFDELKAGLGPLATDEQIQAMMTMMDVNHDGLISEVEALRYQIISDSNILFAKIDTNGDKALTHDEFMAGVAGMASDEVLQGFWNSLDLNHDQLLTATEAIPLQIATSLSSYFDTLDSNTDGLLTYAELQSGLGGLATDYQIQQLIWAVDANGDGMISEQEAATFKLGALNTKADYQAQQLVALSYIATDIQKVDDNTANINYWQGEALGKFDVMIMWLHNIAQYTNLDYQNTARVAAHFTGYSFATGGIAEGPLSGYGATLHGREAVIPLGDGNKVVATLRDPINASPPTSFDEGLRASLDELRAELLALRRDQQAIGATTVGELKDHNRRERRRDVVPQQVEVIS